MGRNCRNWNSNCYQTPNTEGYFDNYNTNQNIQNYDWDCDYGCEKQNVNHGYGKQQNNYGCGRENHTNYGYDRNFDNEIDYNSNKWFIECWGDNYDDIHYTNYNDNYKQNSQNKNDNKRKNKNRCCLCKIFKCFGRR